MKLRSRLLWFALALLLPFAAASAAGLPLAKKTVTVKNANVDISVSYPVTGNKAIDAVLQDYVRASVAEFKSYKPDFANSDHQYQLETTYVVERNDAQAFGVVFTEYSDTGGAHPNSDYKTFDFLLPDGARIFLPEILDGAGGIARLSAIATARLIKDIAGGAEPLSDQETIANGAGPLADNFKHFILLPGKLHIYFPAYQVASYAAGPQEVTIPLQDLKDVIRADWRAPAPSFDCAKAATGIEKAICADAALARLDRQVAEIYQLNLHSYAYDPAIPARLRQEQRDWVARRNKSCAGPAPSLCLTKFYRDRLAVLNKPPV